MVDILDVFTWNGTKLVYKNSALILSSDITADSISNAVSTLTCKLLDGEELDMGLTYWVKLQTDNVILYGSIYNIKYDDLDNTIIECNYLDGISKASVGLSQGLCEEVGAVTGTTSHLVQTLNLDVAGSRDFFGATNAPVLFTGTVPKVTFRFLLESKKYTPAGGIEKDWTYGEIAMESILRQLFITYSIVPKVTLARNMVFNVAFEKYDKKTQTKLSLNEYPVINYTKVQTFAEYGQCFVVTANPTYSETAFKLAKNGDVWQVWGRPDVVTGLRPAKNVESGVEIKDFAGIEAYNTNTKYISAFDESEYSSTITDALRTLRENWANHNIVATIDDNNIRKYINQIGSYYTLYENRQPIYTKLTAVSKKTDGLLELTFGYVRPKLSDQINKLKTKSLWE